MKAGQVIRSFSAKDGRKVVLRTPKWEDLDGLLELINSLVEERAEITKNEKVSREEEIEWLSKTLASLEKYEIFFLVAEVNGKVVCSSDIRPLGGFSRHVGVVGIMGLKVLTLSAFATNKRALHVYEKVGFKRAGVIPKKFFKDGVYIDEVVMAKPLE